MAIKIIKSGVRLTDPIRFSCCNCGCEFTATCQDYRRVGNNFVINCPFCGDEIHNTESNLLIRRRLETNYERRFYNDVPEG